MKTAMLVSSILLIPFAAGAQEDNIIVDAGKAGSSPMLLSNQISTGSTTGTETVKLYYKQEAFTDDQGFCFLSFTTGMLDSVRDWAAVRVDGNSRQWELSEHSDGSGHGLNAGIRCMVYR